MSNIKRYFCKRALGLALVAMASRQLQAQSTAPATTIPETYVLPSSSADTTKPGFIFNISEVAQDTHPNLLSNAEKQLAGLYGDNLADPSAVAVASGPAQPPNPSTAPIRFEIPTVINLNKDDGQNRGDFRPNEVMPGLPGTTGSKDNVAGEVLAYLDLPAGNTVMGVISATYFRVQIGGVTLGDQFGVNVGQLEGGSRWGYSFNINVTKAGLYPARLIFENAGNDRTYVQWFTGLPGAKILINDVANGGIKAYRSVTQLLALAHAQRLVPGNGEVNVAPDAHFHVELVDGSSAIDKTTVSAQLDAVAVTPSATINKVGSVTSADFSSSTPLTPGVHTAALVYTEGGSAVTKSWRFTVGKFVTLDPAWQVAGVDTTKPGFNWNVFANADGGNLANTVIRAENNLSLFAVDATGAVLPNLADPNAKGAAIAAAAPAIPANAPLHFEIEGVINLDATQNMPGSPSTDGSANGQAAEIITYLTLPAGFITMSVNHDDAFSTASGPNPQDAFGRVELGANAGATTTSFSFLVQQAGTYPFRTVWENGGGGSVIRWSTVKADGTTVLVNDLANGGIPAFRATTTASGPYVKGANPPAVPRQLEFNSSSVSVVLVDGANPVVDASVTFQLDGKAVTTPPVRQGKYLTVNTGEVAGFQAASEAHTGVLTFKDSTGASRTQQWAIYNLQNLILPASPVTGENFDSYPEASSEATTVPPGWVATNYTLHETAGWDLTSTDTDAYWNWVIISTDTVTGIEKEVMQNDTSQKINGAAIGDKWMTGNLMFAASDGRAGNGDPQVQITVTKPFDLSTVNNPVLTFYSGQRITGNQSEANAVEYSVDGGTTWLPAAYYHKIDTIFLNPDGTYDALTMFNNVNGHTPTWAVPGVAGISGGTFGGGIAAPISQALAPYIAERSDGITSRRVEAIRLPQASKKNDVRLRFSHVGSCGWEWGVDNIAFYDVAATVTPPPPGGQPTELGQTVNGFQDDFTGATRDPNWVPVGPGGDHYIQADGVLKVSAAIGDPNHLLYIAPGSSNSVQEVLARIRVLTFGQGDPWRAGIGAGVTTNKADLSRGINFEFRDDPTDGNEAAGQKARKVKLLNDALSWGPTGVKLEWVQNTWYWLRLRHDPNAAGSTNDAFGKVWLADGVTPEPTDWQTKWNYTPKNEVGGQTFAARSGYAGITGSSTSSGVTGNVNFEVDYILIKAEGLPSITVNFDPQGPVANPPEFTSITAKGSNITLQWFGAAKLQSADDVAGPWTDVANAISPKTVPIGTTTQKFYRLQ